jgi:tRNA1(Val) A37 N6-methylase TrmN6
MTVEQLRTLLHAQPFRPFVIHLADGREVEVLHQEFAIIAPQGRTAIVYRPDESFEIIDIMLVTSLEVSAPETAHPTS